MVNVKTTNNITATMPRIRLMTILACVTMTTNVDADDNHDDDNDDKDVDMMHATVYHLTLLAIRGKSRRRASL